MIAPKYGRGVGKELLISLFDDLRDRRIARGFDRRLQHQNVIVAKFYRDICHQMSGHIGCVDPTQWLLDQGTQPAFHDALDDRLHDGVLVGEVTINLPNTHLGVRGNRADARSVKSMKDDTLLGRHHDLVTSQLVPLGFGGTPTFDTRF